MRERHLEIDLRELELSIGALILVAEAARELDVAVHARDHQDLLEDLRRLRQREELAGMHAARHEEVARAFRRRLGENRRLDLPEALLVEVVPERQRDAVAQPDVALQPRPAQIEIAILQPRLLGDVRVLGNRERRRLGLVEDAQLARAHLDLAGRHVGVDRLRRAALDPAEDRDDELRPQPLGALEQRVVAFDDHLRVAVRSRTSMKTSEPRSRTLCTQPSSTTSVPTSAARSAPQVCVRARLPSCSAMSGIR